MSNLKEWLNPLLPAENRVQISDGEIERLCAQLKAAEERAERYRAALEQIANMPHAPDAYIVASAALAEGEVKQ